MAKTKFGYIDSKGKQRVVLSLDLKKLKSKDPLAFAYGRSQGLQGKKLPKNKKGLAREYIRGFKIGHKELLKGYKKHIENIIETEPENEDVKEV